MPKPLVVKGWSIARMQRCREGVIDTDHHQMINPLRTNICSLARHRSCAAVNCYHTGLRGQCYMLKPHCSSAEDRMCKELGAPPLDRMAIDREAYAARRTAIEKYLYRMFRRCRPVTITITRGHPDE